MVDHQIDRAARLAVRVALVAVAVALIAVSTVVTTWAADDLATDYPEYPYLRAVYTVGVMIVLVAGLVVLFGVWRLLDHVGQDTLFEPGQTRDATTIVFALLLVGAVCLALNVVTWLYTDQQNPGMGILLIVVGGTAWAGAALTWVLRRLAEQAAAMKHELSEVV